MDILYPTQFFVFVRIIYWTKIFLSALPFKLSINLFFIFIVFYNGLRIVKIISLVVHLLLLNLYSKFKNSK